MTKTQRSLLRVLMTQTAESPMVRLMGVQGLTQKDIADCLGVSRTTVSNWMTGKITPCLSLKDWDKLANLLGVTIDKLPRNFVSDEIEN